MNTRFTIDGSSALETQLGRFCGQATEGVQRIIPGRQLEAFVLGGGYGRGEGGVLKTGAEDEPYNDLEFYILLESDLFYRRYRDSIHRLSEELTRSAGIEVEFKVLSLGKLTRSPVTMFYYDLVSGHRLLAGSEKWLLSCEHHRAAHRIPLYEATRLLMNRCSGLLFSQDRLSRETFREEDADFVGRNLAKAKLCFGDILLTMRGQYHWSCRERHKRLKKLVVENGSGNLTPFLLLHEQGVNFKLHPVRNRCSAVELAAELSFLKEVAQDLWLTLENRRLGKTFASVGDYAVDPWSKCPETKGLKNRLVNARTFGLGGLLSSRYPRERLLRTLPLLLWEQNSREFGPLVRAQLRTSFSDAHALVNVYKDLWRNYN